MIKRWILTFLLLCISIFAEEYRELSDINSIVMEVEESLNVNGSNKESRYTIKFVKPDKIRKEISSPELNKGEIYIYSNGEKIVYLPFFDQVSVEKAKADENEFIQGINYILEKEKNDVNFKKNYYSKKIKELDLENGIRIKIDNFKKFNGYLLPQNYIVYDGELEVAKLKIKSYNINLSIDDKEFQLK